MHFMIDYRYYNKSNFEMHDGGKIAFGLLMEMFTVSISELIKNSLFVVLIDNTIKIIGNVENELSDNINHDSF